MIDLPRSTYVHRRMPKEAFYRNLSLTAALKEKFVTDVDRIYVENSLTARNLNLENEINIKEILVLFIELKKQEFDGKIIEAIARQNPHKLLFLLSFGDNCQSAVYHGKLYCSPWLGKDEIEMKVSGFSLDEIWEHFIEQIALYEERTEVATGLSLEERLVLQERIVKLEKHIAKTEKAAWREQQPKKRFELYTRLQTYKKDLDKLKRNH